MDDYLQRQICERIRKARKAAGLTQEDMANLLNVTTRAYQNYERDRVPFRSLGKVAQITGVSQEWLLRGDTAEPTEPVSARLERLEAQVTLGLEAVEAAIERLAAQLPRRARSG